MASLNSQSGRSARDYTYMLLSIPVARLVHGLSGMLVDRLVAKLTNELTISRDIEKRSSIVIPLLISAKEDSVYGASVATSIPKQYKAILHHMFVKNIDTKQIKRAYLSCHKNVLGLGDTKKLSTVGGESEKYDYAITYPRDILLGNNIRLLSRCAYDGFKRTTNGDISTSPFVAYDIEIYSYTLTSEQLHKKLDKWTDAYDVHMNQINRGNQFYLMYEKSHTHMQTDVMRGEQPRIPVTRYSFEIHRFDTKKTFDNVFFDEKELLLDRLNTFMHNKPLYDRMGQPHTFGMLFHGAPGCGKTSTIKAIANLTSRNVVNVSLSLIKTYKELRDVFFTSSYESINLEFDNKIIVLEDIDCMADVILARDAVDKNPRAMVDGNVSADMIANAITRANKDEKKESNAGITLSELLNLLDGVLEQPGRMIIITTNHVDRIDPALLRFGRVDLKIEFKLCSLSVVRDITRHFFDANGKDARPDGVALSDLDKVDLSDLDKVDLDDMGLDEMAPNDLAKYRGIAENRFSPSDVLETCFRSKSIDDAIRALIARSSPDPNKCDHIY